MSKKQRGKSGSTAAPVSNKWEAGLLAAPIDEDEWTSSITLVVPNKIDDIPHIDVLGHAVQSGTRRQFGIISKNVLIEEIKELGSPKYKKTKDSPPHMDICEFARPILESGEEIPLQLLCRLIKFKILWLKQQDQLRVANEKKIWKIEMDQQITLTRKSSASTSNSVNDRRISKQFRTLKSRLGDIDEEDSEISRSDASRAGNRKTHKNNPIPEKRRGSIALSVIREDIEAASDKDKGGGKDVKGGKGKPKSAAKKGKGGKTPEPPSIKGGTKLKKRGEEDEKTYIDDEPLDGASFYVIVTGFNHPHILPLMAEIGIYFDSVINLSSDIYIEPEIKISAEPPPVKDEKTLALEEEQRQRRLKEISEIESFWKDYLLLMSAAPEGSKVHDTAIEKVTVKRAVIPDHLEDDKDGEKKMSYGLAVYEEVACKAYDILDLKRQHKNFLKNLRLIHVPVQGEDAAIESVKDQGLADSMNVGLDVDMRYYNDLMNTIPQESVSVPLIMYCMLEQVMPIRYYPDSDTVPQQILVIKEALIK